MRGRFATISDPRVDLGNGEVFEPGESRDARASRFQTAQYAAREDFDREREERDIGRSRERLAAALPQLSPQELDVASRDEVYARSLLTGDTRTDLATAARQRKRDALIRAGVPANMVDLAVEDPSIADRVLFPPANRSRSGSTSSLTPERRNLSTLGQQIDDTRADLNRETTALRAPLPSERAPGYREALESRRGAQERLGGLRQRLDSLSGVRDSVAGKVMGQPSGARDITVQGRTGDIPNDLDARDAEFERAARRYQRLLSTPGVDRQEARKAYDATVAAIVRRYAQ